MRLRTAFRFQKPYLSYVLLLFLLNVLVIKSLFVKHATYSNERAETVIQNESPMKPCSKTNSSRMAQSPVKLVLFSSFQLVSSKYKANKNALENWKTLPGVKHHVVFTNCVNSSQLARSLKFTVLPVTDHAIGGVPVLRTMFLTVKSMFPSSYLMYSNADILYEADFVDTIVAVDKYVGTGNRNSLPSLIVGKRTNYNISDEESWDRIIRKGKEFGELFLPNAQDYFVTNRQFPWEQVPKFVIGRIGYDNWLVAFARFKRYKVIDASNTIVAVHQTVAGAIFEGFHHDNVFYNHAIIEDSPPVYLFRKWGRTDCCYLATSHDLYNNVIVDSRLVKPSCNHHDFLQNIKSVLWG